MVCDCGFALDLSINIILDYRKGTLVSKSVHKRLHGQGTEKGEPWNARLADLSPVKGHT